MKTEQEQHNKRVIERLFSIEKALEKKATLYQNSILNKFPFLFLILSTFGIIMVFYGFEKILDRVPFLIDSPVAMIIIGFLILILTRTLYRKL